MYLLRSYIFLTLVSIAMIGIWGAFAWFSTTIIKEQATVADHAAALAQTATKSAQDASAHSLERDTKKEREQIAALATGNDAISFIRLLEDTGKGAQTEVSVDSISVDAQPKGDEPQAITVTVHADGSFAGLHQLLMLVESLPVASELRGYDLSYIGQSPTSQPGATWRLVVAVRDFVHIDQ